MDFSAFTNQLGEGEGGGYVCVKNMKTSKQVNVKVDQVVHYIRDEIGGGSL